MVFAAGAGTRLRPWTDSHPKALAPVAGTPALRRVLASLRRAGITDIVVNTHYFHDQIAEYLQDTHISIVNEQPEPLETGGGVKNALPLLGTDAPVLLHNADVLTRGLDLSAMCRAFDTSDADALLLCSHRDTRRHLHFNTDMLLTPEGDIPLAFNGIHIIGPRVLKALADYPLTSFSLTPFYREMSRQLRIRPYIAPESYQWYDIGTPERLAQASQAFA